MDTVVANGMAAKRYEELVTIRDPFVKRGRECAKLTLPKVLPEEGHTETSRFYTPYQSIGSRGVNNLSAKLLLALFPPNTPFFRFKIDDYTLEALSQSTEARAGVEEGLNKMERAIVDAIEASGMRTHTYETLKHLLIIGNALLVFAKDGKARMFRLDQFVVVRDPQGVILEVIVKEMLARETLPKDVQAMLQDQPIDKSASATTEKSINLYTCWKLSDDGKKYETYQEVEGVRIPGSDGSFLVNEPDFLALRWSAIDGEDYGRSYVEDYLGDLISLEGLSKAIVEGSAIAAKTLFLINPNSGIRPKDLAETANGGFAMGEEGAVSTLRVDKAADMSIAYQAAQQIEQRLSHAFLMHSSVQRDAERVTAEEVRYMASELEDALGGVYSLLSQEIQLPYVMNVQARLTKAKKLPKLPKGTVAPTIVTGLEALGRGHDLNKYQLLFQQIGQLGPEALVKYVNISDYITRVGTALGIDMGGLVKTQDQIAQEEQAAQQQMQDAQAMELAKAATGPAINAVSKAPQGA